MTHTSNNDTDLGREDFLIDLQEGAAQLRPYSEDEAAATQFWHEPVDDPEWIVVVGEHDRRMLSTAQLWEGLRAGELQSSMPAWRRGMPAWSPIASIAELTKGAEGRVTPPQSAAPHAPQSLAQFASCSPEPAIDLRPVRPPLTPPPGARFAPPKVSAPAFDSDVGDAASEEVSDHLPSMRVKRAVMGLSALAMFGVFVTMFIISSAREGKSSATLAPLPSSSAAPQASSAQAPSADENASSDVASTLPESAAALLEADDGDEGELPSARATRDEASRGGRL